MISLDEKAAQYVRMSTDMQHYSIENQKELIGLYAASRGLTIVRSYEDAGRSGIGLNGRAALQCLLADVCSGKAEFSTVLVYDVSRWGRFQDSDESAHYEYLCRRAGVKVEYCAELFQNDGSLTATVVKNIKRAMAGEYSRELSAKVFAGQSRLTSKGFHTNGSAGFGLRRLLLDEAGRHKQILEPGERKSLQSERIILVPGPSSERQIIQDVYEMFIGQKMPLKAIAEKLNAKGVMNAFGRPWSLNSVKSVLTNEKYIGSAVYARTSKKLKGRWSRNPEIDWIKTVGAYEAVVLPAQHMEAKRQLAENCRRISNNELLDCLTAIWCKHGRITYKIINASAAVRKGRTYIQRFGALENAYRLIGYKRDSYVRCPRDVKRGLIGEVIENVERHGGKVELQCCSSQLMINDEIRIEFLFAHSKRIYKKDRWRFGHLSKKKPDILVAVRLEAENGPIRDFVVLPFLFVPAGSWVCLTDGSSRLQGFMSDTLAPFYSLCARYPSECAPNG